MASTIDATILQKENGSIRVTWTSGATVGRYRLDEFIGRGGFGEVWKGFDPELNRVVAIKVCHQESAKNPDSSGMFREEARRAAIFKHDGIVPVYDVGKVGPGFFIVSEFIDGPTLAQRMCAGAILRDEGIQIVRSLALSGSQSTLGGNDSSRHQALEYSIALGWDPCNH